MTAKTAKSRERVPIVLYVDVERRSLAEKAKLAGIKRCADAYGWKVRVVWDVRSRPDVLSKALVRQRPIGCIVECAAGHEDLPPKFFRGTPVVYLDSRKSLYGKGAVRVVHDWESIAQLAFRELSSGLPSAYAVVGYDRKSFWAPLRTRSFVQRVAEHGHRCLTFACYGEGRRTRMRKWLARLPENCAVFAANDEVALEVVRASRSIGRRIPGDLTLLGVDDIDAYCLAGEPRISSVRIDFELAGFKACELLRRMCEGEGVRGDAFGPLMVVRRGSTSGRGRHDRRIDAAVELIRREACSGLRACDVVKSMNGSRRLSELRFREAIGHSIHDEISTVRLARVFQLLADSSCPIGQIVRMSGFPTGAALRKAFRLRTGMSLTAWRKRHRRSVVFLRKSYTFDFCDLL